MIEFTKDRKNEKISLGDGKRVSTKKVKKYKNVPVGEKFPNSEFYGFMNFATYVRTHVFSWLSSFK